MEELIIDFIASELLDEGEEISAEDDLLNSGLVDSIGLMRLVSHLEETYSIKINPQDLVIENFRNVHAIKQFLEKSTN